MQKWKTARLGDYCTFQEGYVNPSQRNPDYFDGDIKWIRAVDLKDGYIYDTSRKLTTKGFQSAGKSALLFKPETIVISKSGSIGKLGIIKDYMCGNRATINIVTKSNADLHFIFYLLLSNQKMIADLAVGSVQRNLYVSILENAHFSFPDLEEQIFIGKFISSITDKMTINDRINDNLLQQLQAVYQMMFGKSSHDDKSEGNLSDICCYSKRRIAVSSLSLESYYSTENMLPGKAGSVAASSLPTITQTTGCMPGDILISNIRPYFKKIVYCQSECGCSTDVLCFVPNTPDLSLFLYSTLYADHFFDHMVAGSKGTKMPRGDKQQIMLYPIVLPSPAQLAEFNAIAKPILSKIEICIQENKRLSTMRDTLLPKLMSGEIDVSSVNI